MVSENVLFIAVLFFGREWGFSDLKIPFTGRPAVTVKTLMTVLKPFVSL